MAWNPKHSSEHWGSRAQKPSAFPCFTNEETSLEAWDKSIQACAHTGHGTEPLSQEQFCSPVSSCSSDGRHSLILQAHKGIKASNSCLRHSDEEILRALRLSLKTPSLTFCTTHWEEWKLLLCILFKLKYPQCRYFLERIQTLLFWPKIFKEEASAT